MFTDSMILHAQIRARREMQVPAASETRQESNMDQPTSASTQPQGQEAPKASPMRQQTQHTGLPPGARSQTQSQAQSGPRPPTPPQQGTPDVVTPRGAYVDPLGRPRYQGNPRFTDQQAGGDLTGDESDARDDNFAATGSSQNARDVSAHAERLPAAAAECLRYIAVEAGPEAAAAVAATAGQDAELVPDGSEDPGANADDRLQARPDAGSASERH